MKCVPVSDKHNRFGLPTDNLQLYSRGSGHTKDYEIMACNFLALTRILLLISSTKHMPDAIGVTGVL